MGSRSRRRAVALLSLAGASVASAAPEGTLTIAMHFTPVTRWLDPAEGESTITPFLLLYALHDGLLKPMPGVGSGAEPGRVVVDVQGRARRRLHAARRRQVPQRRPGHGGGREVLVRALPGRRGEGAQGRGEGDPDPGANRVRFVFKEPWPDFSAFYGTFVASAGWVVPKKYVERVGEEGFRKAPIGAGPYKFVSLNPGVELVVEAFEGYWRKPPSIKRIVFRSLPDETTRAAALKSGEVDWRCCSPGRRRRTSGARRAAAGRAAARHLLARLPRSVGSEIAVGRQARAAGRQPGPRSAGAQRGRDAGPLAAHRQHRAARLRVRAAVRSAPVRSRRGRGSSSPRPATRTASTPAS